MAPGAVAAIRSPIGGPIRHEVPPIGEADSARLGDDVSAAGWLDYRVPEMWQELVGSSVKEVHVGARELVFRGGETPKIAVILAGVVRSFTVTLPGRQLTLGYARSGDLIGLAPFFSGTRMWSAEAITDSTLAMVTTQQLRDVAARDPELAWRIAEYIATWAADAVLAAAESSYQSMTVRVAHHLLEVALRTPDGHAVAHISHQRLADAVGTAREVITRELRVLRAQGVIDTRSERVTVIDEERLARIAAG